MTRRIPAALLGACALLLSLLVPASTAQAAGESNAVGACLGSDQVWLLVVTDTDEVLANECVGAPANGTEALSAAALELIRDSSNLICSIGGHPQTCPATFTGQFWGSFQGAPGEEYAFATAGPDENVPTPGTIEAWCYNAPDTQGCTPPYLTIIQDGTQVPAPDGITTVDLPVTGGDASTPEATDTATTPAADATTTDDATTAAPQDDAGQDDADSGGLPWGWIAIGVAVIAGAAVAITAARRKGDTDSGGAVGGR